MMARHISFMLTTEQVKRREKTVTRRNGWVWLQPGTLLWGVEKSQGLKKGEKVVKLALIRVVSVRREPLNAITADDVEREGFAGWSPERFVQFYAGANKCADDTLVTRIEFEYVDAE